MYWACLGDEKLSPMLTVRCAVTTKMVNWVYRIFRLYNDCSRGLSLIRKAVGEALL